MKHKADSNISDACSNDGASLRKHNLVEGPKRKVIFDCICTM